jgi:hypothetical protein
MPELYLLHEAALGYALFKGEEFEDIGANVETVQVGIVPLTHSLTHSLGSVCRVSCVCV